MACVLSHGRVGEDLEALFVADLPDFVSGALVSAVRNLYLAAGVVLGGPLAKVRVPKWWMYRSRQTASV